MLKEFDKVVKHGNSITPTCIYFWDRGSDENPIFPKILGIAIQHLRKNNQDALLISTHAPGLPVNNQVEKKMASLSKALSGILLPHEKFGTRLNSSRKSINTSLKKSNFKVAGEILAKV